MFAFQPIEPGFLVCSFQFRIVLFGKLQVIQGVSPASVSQFPVIAQPIQQVIPDRFQ